MLRGLLRILWLIMCPKTSGVEQEYLAPGGSGEMLTVGTIAATTTLQCFISIELFTSQGPISLHSHKMVVFL